MEQRKQMKTIKNFFLGVFGTLIFLAVFAGMILALGYIGETYGAVYGLIALASIMAIIVGILTTIIMQ